MSLALNIFNLKTFITIPVILTCLVFSIRIFLNHFNMTIRSLLSLGEFESLIFLFYFIGLLWLFKLFLIWRRHFLAVEGMHCPIRVKRCVTTLLLETFWRPICKRTVIPNLFENASFFVFICLLILEYVFLWLWFLNTWPHYYFRIRKFKVVIPNLYCQE